MWIFLNILWFCLMYFINKWKDLFWQKDKFSIFKRYLCRNKSKHLNEHFLQIHVQIDSEWITVILNFYNKLYLYFMHFWWFGDYCSKLDLSYQMYYTTCLKCNFTINYKIFALFSFIINLLLFWPLKKKI